MRRAGASNVEDFSRKLTDVVNRLEEHEVKPFLQKISLDFFRKIVLKTPVKTGRARANWRVSLNEPPEAPIEAFDKTGGPTITAATGLIMSMGSPYIEVHITNNVEYILYLEDGGSKKQAPQGMVAITVAEMQAGLFG